MCVFVRVDGVEGAGPLHWQRFLAPFGGGLWAAVAAAATAVALAHWAATRPRIFAHTLLDALGALCMQGWELALGARRGRSARRLLEAVTSLLALTLYSAFAANLIAALAVRRLRLPFRSFDELLRAPHFQLGVAARSSAFSYFQREAFLQRSRTT